VESIENNNMMTNQQTDDYVNNKTGQSDGGRDTSVSHNEIVQNITIDSSDRHSVELIS
jgi:hypothetical protein